MLDLVQEVETGTKWSVARGAPGYPRVTAVATTLGEVASTRHRWSAVVWMNGTYYTAPICDLEVYDRGGGVRPVLRPPDGRGSPVCKTQRMASAIA